MPAPLPQSCTNKDQLQAKKRRKQNPLGISCFGQEAVLYNIDPDNDLIMGVTTASPVKQGEVVLRWVLSLLPGSCRALGEHLLNGTELSGHFLLCIFTSP